MDKKENIVKKIEIDLSALKSEATVGEPIKREVAWVNGDVENVFNVYIKPSDYYSVVNEFHGVAASVPRDERLAHRISSMIVDESGNQVFTPEDVLKLKGSLVTVLVDAIYQANTLGKTTN